MKALVAAKTGDSVPKKQVFDRWKRILKDNKVEVETFRDSLKHKAEVLKRIASNKFPSGGESEWLKSIKFFGAIQPYTVLLAGSHLNDDSFERLATLVEARTVLSLLTKERSQDFERLMPKWAHAISSLPIIATPDDVFEASESGWKDVEQLLGLFEASMPAVTYRSASDRKRIQYVLARATQVADRKIRNDLRMSDLLAPGRGRRDDVDHILALSRTSDPAWKDLVSDDLVDSLGNLVLLHASDNRSVQASPPLDKEAVYAHSQYLLTRVLARQSALSADTPKRIEVALNELRTDGASVDRWDASAIDARARLYVRLVMEDLRRVCSRPSN